MPGKALPDRPNLDQYKKQAKELLRAWHAADPEALARVAAHHPRLRARAAAPDAAFQLADAQLVIAREHGDATWTAFAARIGAIVGAAPVPPWKLAEDAVVRGDAEALAALLREHGEALRRGHPSTWSGGLAPSYAEAEARTIITREHFFDTWDAFAAANAAKASQVSKKCSRASRRPLRRSSPAICRRWLACWARIPSWCGRGPLAGIEPT